jgi:hypothetical protein
MRAKTGATVFVMLRAFASGYTSLDTPGGFFRLNAEPLSVAVGRDGPR